MMKFLEYSCYFLYQRLINKGKFHDTAKIAAVGYVMVSLFFFFITPLLFLRFVNLDIDDKYEFIIKGIIILVALIVYIYLYYNIEKERKFKKIIEKYEGVNSYPYSKYVIWIFILGGLFCFCLAFVVLAIISRS